MDIKRIVSPKCHLPEELCREILLRLSVKSLLRFCCVSKLWLSLIKDPDFTRLHLQNFKNNHDETHLLVVQGRSQDCVVRRSDTFETNTETLLTLGAKYGDGSWSINCSIDGLFLLSSWERHGINNSRTTNRLRIWNPSIRKFHDIPSLPEIDNSHDRFYLEGGEIGLGYDPLMEDYKYVKLVRESRNQPPLVAVYTLGAGSWKIIPCQVKEGSNLVWDFSYTSDAVYLRGNLYFIATHKESNVSELVSFGVSSEVFCSVSLPYEDLEVVEARLTLVGNGYSSLVLCHFYDSLTMWVLETESMCWTEPYESLVVAESEFLYLKKNRDILLWWNSEETIYTLATKRDFNLTLVSSYNLDTKEEKVLLIQEERYSFEFHQVYGYMESLVLLN